MFNFRRRGGRSKETQSNTTSKPSRFPAKQSSKGQKYTDLTGKITNSSGS